jgi:hypothetical protein
VEVPGPRRVKRDRAGEPERLGAPPRYLLVPGAVIVALTLLVRASLEVKAVLVTLGVIADSSMASLPGAREFHTGDTGRAEGWLRLIVITGLHLRALCVLVERFVLSLVLNARSRRASSTFRSIRLHPRSVSRIPTAPRFESGAYRERLGTASAVCRILSRGIET